jgi:TetR/AcrR family acrAB operon transcriptional repressor
MVRKTRAEALETREKLLESALDVMSEHPFSSVSMSEIASRVGLSKGAAYWHFKNKSDILLNLVEKICSLASRDLFDVEHPPHAMRDIREYYRRKMLRAFESERVKKINRLMHRRDEWPEDVREKVIAMIIAGAMAERDMVKQIFVMAQEDGTVRRELPAHDIATLLTAIFHGLFIFQFHEVYDLDFSRYTDFLFDAFEKEIKN